MEDTEQQTVESLSRLLRQRSNEVTVLKLALERVSPSNAIKRNLVKNAILKKGGRRRSDRDIASQFGFSHTFVAKVRREVCGAVVAKKREGRDGRVRKMPSS